MDRTTAAWPDDIKARYGIRPTPWWQWALLATVIVSFLVAVIYAGVQLAKPKVQSALTAWKEISPTHTQVSIDVRKPKDATVTCVVRAQDSARTDLGYASFNVPPGDDFSQVTYELHTLGPAYVAELLGCDIAGQPMYVPPAAFPPGIQPPTQPWKPTDG